MWLTQDFLEDLLSKVLASLWRDYWYSYRSSWTPRLLYFHCLLQITRVLPQANNSLACLSVCANSISFEVLKVTSGLKGHYYMTSHFIAKWQGPVSFVLLWSIHVPWLPDCSLFVFKLRARSPWTKTLSSLDNRENFACKNAVFKLSCLASIGVILSTVTCFSASLSVKEKVRKIAVL